MKCKKHSGSIVSFLITLSLLSSINLFISPNSFADPKIPRVKLSVKPLDLSRVPTTEELMAAGQLGGELHPTDDIRIKSASPIMVLGSQSPTSTPEFLNPEGVKIIDRNNAFNLSFGHAIQEWNKHKYKEAVKMFKQYVLDFPDSPWVSEAKLHIGCDAKYNGRYSEAEGLFNEIISDNKGKNHYGAKMLLNKARQRLGILRELKRSSKAIQRIKEGKS